jgi:chaperone required for assembly of F1-ATPase
MLYSAFYEWQLELLKSMDASTLPVSPFLSLAVNEAKGARCGSTVFETRDFRKVEIIKFMITDVLICS